MPNFLLKSTFQYSTIPLFHVRDRSSGLEKNTYILNKLYNFRDVKLEEGSAYAQDSGR